MSHEHFEPILKALDDCLVFNLFSPAEKAQLARQSKWKTFEKNDEVFSFEHKGHYFYVVAEGNFQLRLKSNQLRSFGPRDIFGEIALFNDKTRTGAIRALTNGSLVAISKDLLLPTHHSLLPSELRYKLTFSLAQHMAEYFYDKHLLTTREIIAHGESEKVEFKVSITQEQIKEGIAKTLCAFSNKEGGTIFVGVTDKNTIVGVGKESGKTLEEFRRDVGGFVKDRLYGYRQYTMDVEEVDRKPVLRIDCEASEVPVFYKDKEAKDPGAKEVFFVRNDTRNEVISHPSEAIRYVQRRFVGHT